jgi:hypothetical protein
MRLTLPRMKGTATNTLRAKPSPSPTLNRLHSDQNFGAAENWLKQLTSPTKWPVANSKNCIFQKQ